MNLENYVCPLDQAKKLDKLLGMRKSVFVWLRTPGDSHYGIYLVSKEMRKSGVNTNGYNAYTSQELGEMISDICERWISEIDGSQLIVDTVRNPNALGYFDRKHPEAQARAEFLIYLLESKDV